MNDSWKRYPSGEWWRASWRIARFPHTRKWLAGREPDWSWGVVIFRCATLAEAKRIVNRRVFRGKP